eukprot:TRINITY_DN3213_c0_g1_i1.p1 TRINITY_DN3213_c0_g1~~TRINITY_DN3213_c0_g1_i1.p1  ORF type:complete len:253 (+),score=92.16 TRINITY_DN3213_c0_g1_i1:70-759(+)
MESTPSDAAAPSPINKSLLQLLDKDQLAEFVVQLAAGTTGPEAVAKRSAELLRDIDRRADLIVARSSSRGDDERDLGEAVCELDELVSKAREVGFQGCFEEAISVLLACGDAFERLSPNFTDGYSRGADFVGDLDRALINAMMQYVESGVSVGEEFLSGALERVSRWQSALADAHDNPFPSTSKFLAKRVGKAPVGGAAPADSESEEGSDDDSDDGPEVKKIKKSETDD